VSASRSVVESGGFLGGRFFARRGGRSVEEAAPPKVMKKRLGPAATSSSSHFYGTVVLSIVIPSEAEGLQVYGPFVEMLFDRTQRSGEICGFFSHAYTNALTSLSSHLAGLIADSKPGIGLSPGYKRRAQNHATL
jgi:hypothetical protein